MTGRAIGLRTKNTVPAINLNPAAKLRSFPIIYIMLNGPRAIEYKKARLLGVRPRTIVYEYDDTLLLIRFDKRN